MQKVASLKRSQLRFASFGGQTVIGRHQQLVRLLQARLGGDAMAAMLTEPQVNIADDEVAWYTNLRGIVKPLSALPMEAQEQVKSQYYKNIQQLEELENILRAEGGKNSLSLDPDTILAIGRVPDQETALFALEETATNPDGVKNYRPLMVAWACEWVTADRPPVDLIAAMRRTPTPPQTFATETAAKTAATVAPETVPIAPTPTTTVIAVERAGPSWLLWLLNLLLLIVILLLLLRSCDGGNLRFGGAAPLSPSSPVPAAPLNDEELALRREIAELSHGLDDKLKRCLPPEPLKQAPPEPQPAPAPQPTPQPTPTPPTLAPEPQPAPVPAPMPPAQTPGKDLVIPEGAEKKNDLSFLKGCWSSITGLKSSATGHPIEHLYCFDNTGNGDVTVRFIGGEGQCHGAANARFSQDTLKIDVPNGASCKSKVLKGFARWRVQCRSSEAGVAQCDGINADNSPFGVKLKRN